jgi:hypothetical protein
MGLFAVARLAERHGVRVRLRPALPQGLSALVWLPDSLIERTTKASSTSGWSGQQVSARPATAEVPAYAGGGHAIPASGSPASGTATIGTATIGNGNGSGYGLAGARMPSGWFRRGQAGSMLPAAAGAGLGEHGAAAAYAERANGDQSTAGLPLRVPRAGRGPGGGPPDGQGAVLPGRTPGVPAAGSGGSPLPQRSPDQARSRLAGFQRGTRRAEGQGGSGGNAPQSGEGTGR